MPKQENLKPYMKKHGDYTYYIDPKGGTIEVGPDGNAMHYKIIHGGGGVGISLEKPFTPNPDFYIDETKIVGDLKYNAEYFYKNFNGFE